MGAGEGESQTEREKGQSAQLSQHRECELQWQRRREKEKNSGGDHSARAPFLPLHCRSLRRLSPSTLPSAAWQRSARSAASFLTLRGLSRLRGLCFSTLFLPCPPLAHRVPLRTPPRGARAPAPPRLLPTDATLSRASFSETHGGATIAACCFLYSPSSPPSVCLSLSLMRDGAFPSLALLPGRLHAAPSGGVPRVSRNGGASPRAWRGRQPAGPRT